MENSMKVLNAVFTIVESDSPNELANVISDYVAGEQFEANKWADMVMYAYNGNYDADGWKGACETAEEDQAGRREAKGEKIERTKAGKVICSKAFPKTYRTDKAIIGKALQEGVSLVDADGIAKPKSALQEEYKEAAEVSKPEKPAYEKITTVINAYEALFDQLTHEEQGIISGMVTQFHSTRGF